MNCDALIVGGGPAGAIAGLLLARAGWSVVVVEKAAFPRQKVCGEYLSAGVLPLFGELGLANQFLEIAGPEIRRVAVFHGETTVAAPMPRAKVSWSPWGRALGREHLDAMLLAHAARAGATVWQPGTLIQLNRREGSFTAVAKNGDASLKLNARLVIAAHGSWERGPLATQCSRETLEGSDLLGFKAHFLDSRLAPDLMPLLAFPGGYGGMVSSDHGRVSLSCCIRRDRLQTIRRANPDANAGAAVFAHIFSACRGVRDALAHAQMQDAWIAAGPIRPGVRARYAQGVFVVGNAAGEAHPIVAEGISMAVQSSWLLCERLIAREKEVLSGRAHALVGREYARAWRRRFAARIYASALFANVAMRPGLSRAALQLLRAAPGLLTTGAKWSGKIAPVPDSGALALNPE